MKSLLLMVFGVIAGLAEKSQVLRDFAVSNSHFAADVYKQLVKVNNGTFLLCPLSAEIILALADDGAGGQTEKQLTNALHFPKNKEKREQIFRELTPQLRGNANYTLTSANKIYVENGFKINEKFNRTAVEVFNAEIQSIDFANNQEAASEINEWVAKQTNNKIQNLISPNVLNADTRSVLVNAMYFHGTWVHSFPKEATELRTFYVNSNKQVQVEMMQQTNRFLYYNSDDLKAQFVILPYEGNGPTMTIVLPNKKDGLSALEEHIEEVLVEKNYSSRLVDIGIPKFTTETTIQFNPILKNLGVVEAFGNNANFSGILVNQPLKISTVIQKTFIEVQENGTTAAAATAVVGVRPTAIIVPPLIISFVADHPFLYFLKIKDFVLFVGRYIRP